MTQTTDPTEKVAQTIYEQWFEYWPPSHRLRAIAASRCPDDIKRQNEWMDQQLKIALGETEDGQ